MKRNLPYRNVQVFLKAAENRKITTMRACVGVRCDTPGIDRDIKHDRLTERKNLEKSTRHDPMTEQRV